MFETMITKLGTDVRTSITEPLVASGKGEFHTSKRATACRTIDLPTEVNTLLTVQQLS
jgi:hypothetical protein